VTFVQQTAERQAAPADGAKTSPARLNALLGLLLVAATLAVYYPVQRQPFANYDDPDYVSENLHVRSGLNWSTVKWAMSTRDAANWHPVTWLSHALDVQVFGLTPAGPHDVNVVLHIVNALLLFWVLSRVTGCRGPSWLAAGLFALHPINVESVAWISERKNLLSMLFLLLALEAYRRYAAADSRTRTARYVLVVVLFALGLMSKPQVITFPFVLLLWDYWPLGRIAIRQKNPEEASGEQRKANGEWRLLILEKLPLFALSIVSAMITLTAQAAGGATSAYPLSIRVENALVSYARYLGKFVWPANLAPFYPYPLKPYPHLEVVASALLLLGITVAVARARRGYLTVGWLWFLGTLVPMIGVVQVGTQAMADRYAYLPFIGLFVMVSWLAAEVWQRLRLSRSLAIASSIVVLAALGFLSHRQVGYWNDHITLWTHTLAVTQDNWVAENNLGTALLKLARVEEAIPHFRAAVALEPDDPNANLNIGTYEQMHGNLPAAIERYKAAAQVARNVRTKSRALNNLGYAYKGMADFSSARESFRQAVQVDPEFAGAWISLGLMAQRTGDLPQAIDAYSHAVQVRPTDYGYLLLAGALGNSGDKAGADAARTKAAGLSRNLGASQRYADELLTH
jgi:Flp pilus assembly protein TadD